MLLRVMGVGFDNTCTFGEVKCLQGYSKTLWMGIPFRLSPVVVDCSVVVMSARLNPIGSQFSIPVL